MNTDFQDQLTKSILLLTPGMLLLSVLGVLGLLMLMERLGLLSARAQDGATSKSSPPAAAATQADTVTKSNESPK